MLELFSLLPLSAIYDEFPTVKRPSISDLLVTETLAARETTGKQTARRLLKWKSFVPSTTIPTEC